ncbi:MAG: RHS repeat-associated core domain-containing protein [Saprospiraceae bacterium]
MAQEGPWMNNSSGDDSRYTYGNKEFNSDYNWDVLDFGPRQYNASLARWNQIDPMSEAAVNFHSYHYAGLNPISNSDPSGMFSWNASNSSNVTDGVKSIMDNAEIKDLKKRKSEDPIKNIWRKIMAMFGFDYNTLMFGPESQERATEISNNRESLDAFGEDVQKLAEAESAVLPGMDILMNVRDGDYYKAGINFAITVFPYGKVGKGMSFCVVFR